MQVGREDHSVIFADRWTPVLVRLQGRRELLSQLAESYCAGLPDLLTQLAAACAVHNALEVARIAHVLLGQAGQFAAAEMVAAAQNLETLAQTGKIEAPAVHSLAEQSRHLAHELQTWQQAPATSRSASNMMAPALR